jgi:hypothetical protein
MKKIERSYKLLKSLLADHEFMFRVLATNDEYDFEEIDHSGKHIGKMDAEMKDVSKLNDHLGSVIGLIDEKAESIALQSMRQKFIREVEALKSEIENTPKCAKLKLGKDELKDCWTIILSSPSITLSLN